MKRWNGLRMLGGLAVDAMEDAADALIAAVRFVAAPFLGLSLLPIAALLEPYRENYLSVEAPSLSSLCRKELQSLLCLIFFMMLVGTIANLITRWTS